MLRNNRLGRTHAGAAARLPAARRQTRRLRPAARVLVAAMFAWGLLALAPTPAHAAEIRQGDVVVVAPGETINDDLYAFGQTVAIQGTVNGDVVVAGQSVTIAGHVNGDLMAAASTLVVSGPVTGAARLAGQSVAIGAPIGDDLLVGAATLDAAPGASVGRDVFAGGSTVTLGGPVGRSIRAGAERLTLGGPVGGDVMARVESLRVASGATIQGSLSYASAQDPVFDPGSSVRGTTTRLPSDLAPTPKSPAAQAGEGALAWFRTLLGLSVFGLTLVWLFPGFSNTATATLARKPWASLGLGLALFVGGPAAALLLFVAGLALGGWWIGPLVLALYLGTLPVGGTVVGLFLGRLVMRRIGRPGVATGWSLVAGLVFLGVVSLVPVVGALASLAALLFGLGAGLQAVISIYRQHATPNDASSPPGVHPEWLGEPLPAR